MQIEYPAFGSSGFLIEPRPSNLLRLSLRALGVLGDDLFTGPGLLLPVEKP